MRLYFPSFLTFFIIMFAVILTGAKQYLVKEGDVIHIEKVKTSAGNQHVFNQVLLKSKDDHSIDIGTPFLSANVSGEIVNQEKDKKIRVFKMKAKKNYRRVYGHRQPYSEVKITKIS